MLFGCYDEKEMWITELDRIIMFKAMVDHGLSLENYKFDLGNYQDYSSAETFYECVEEFAKQYGIDYQEGENREYCFRLTFPFDEQCVWGHERSKLQALKKELGETLRTINSDTVYSEWEGESTIRVDVEGGQEHGTVLYRFLETFEKIKPYMEVKVNHDRDHHVIGTVIATY